MSENRQSAVLRFRIIGVSIAGAVAVLCYVLSLMVASGVADVLRPVAYAAAAICAVIGVSFAFTGSSR